MKRSRWRILKAIGEGYDKARAKSQIDTFRKLLQLEQQSLLTFRNAKIIPPDFVEEGKKQILQNFADALYRTNIVTWTITDDYDDPILRGKVRIEGTLRVAGPKEEA